MQQPNTMINTTAMTASSLTPIVQDLISRICNTLNSQRKTIEDVFRGVISENVAGI